MYLKTYMENNYNEKILVIPEHIVNFALSLSLCVLTTSKVSDIAQASMKWFPGSHSFFTMHRA